MVEFGAWILLTPQIMQYKTCLYMFNFITNTKINTCLFVWYNGKSQAELNSKLSCVPNQGV